MRGGIVGLIVAVLVAIVAYSSIFVVYPTDQAIVLQFGQVRRSVTQPGLYFKVPFIQNVVTLDKRILELDVPELEAIASDQKRLVVDAFARYRIQNPVLFYQTVNNVPDGNRRLSTFVQSAVRSVLADATFIAVVRDDRPQLMERIRQEVERRAQGIGVTVVDVRIRRADLPEANSQAIYRRMQTEREREATEIRAQGEEAARRIRAQADRQATVIVAEANKTSEELRGDGDARRSAVFSAAYGRDPSFFTFYRSMQAYREALKPDGTQLVLSPKSQFFRYFNDPIGAGGGLTLPPTTTPAPAAPAPTTP